MPSKWLGSYLSLQSNTQSIYEAVIGNTVALAMPLTKLQTNVYKITIKINEIYAYNYNYLVNIQLYGTHFVNG